MINQITLMGCIEGDINYSQTEQGVSRTSFRIKHVDIYKKRTGEIKETIVWITIEAWGPLAEECHSNFKTGSFVLVTGALRYSSFVDKEGAKRSRHTILADEVLPMGELVPTEISLPKTTQRELGQAVKRPAPQAPRKSPIVNPEEFNDDLPF